MKFFELHKKFIGVFLLAFMSLGMLTACSSSEEEDADSTKDEICDEADAGSQGCPG